MKPKRTQNILDMCKVTSRRCEELRTLYIDNMKTLGIDEGLYITLTRDCVTEDERIVVVSYFSHDRALGLCCKALISDVVEWLKPAWMEK